MTFRTLSIVDLCFEIPDTDDYASRDLDRFADHVKGSMWKLNLARCATLQPDQLDRIARYGVSLSKEVEEKIASLRRGKIINISLQGSDLTITATPNAVQNITDCTYESKTKTYRTWPKNLWQTIARCESTCRILIDIPLKHDLSLSFEPKFSLRGYQARCYDSWRTTRRGVIVLPTGSGKTFLAFQAIAELGVKTLIVVPSIDLLHQWKRGLISSLGVPKERIGIYGGGTREVKDITVSTYDSAYLNAENFSGLFMLIVADEAHHAVAEEYHKVFYLSIARFRMGLTATPLRSDGKHKDYEEVLGPIIKPISQTELEKKGYIAGYDLKRIFVQLGPQAFADYRAQIGLYEEYCGKRFPNIRDPKRRFEVCLRYATRDLEARRALRARSNARVIALSAERKVEAVGDLLSEHKDKKVLIFSRYVDVVKEVSRRYLIPLIVAETSNEERTSALDMFRKGEVTKLASGMTLEEGIDVPDAEVGIIISGSGSNREYLQRVGRLLRPKKENALVIEIVTEGTLDQQLSLRRKRFREWIPKGR